MPTFTVYHTLHRIHFEYDRNIFGKPYAVVAWLEFKTAKGEWKSYPNYGAATLEEHSRDDRARLQRRLHDAINVLNLRPAIRKQAIRAANKLVVPAAFNKETGRKLALARHLKAICWDKQSRTAVWDAYFGRLRSQPVFGETHSARSVVISGDIHAGEGHVVQTRHERPQTIEASIAESARLQSVSRREREEIEAAMERIAVERELREEEVWEDWDAAASARMWGR